MIHSQDRNQLEFAILPPTRIPVSGVFQNVTVNPQRHRDLMAEMQRFRGAIYAGDGAIRADDLTSDGRHKVRADEQSWHVLALGPGGRVCGCLRYLEEPHARGFDDLSVRHAALARSPMLGWRFRKAVETEMTRARQVGIGFGEVGGWAVAEEYRGTLEPLRLVLAIVALMDLRGGSAGVVTATARHHSATILRRIGLHPLQADGSDLPSYYDPQYSCEMEVLRFDSRFPNPKYREWVDQLSAGLRTSPVICPSSAASSLQDGFRNREALVAEPVMEPAA
jgi:hypothetical protein